MHKPRVFCCLLALALGAFSATANAETINVCFQDEAGLHMVQRELPGSATLATSMDALMAGPTANEQAQGIFSAIPVGTTVKSLAVEGDTTVVDLSAEVLTGLDDVTMAAMFDQARITAESLGLKTAVKLTTGGQPLKTYLPAGAPVPPPAKHVAIPAGAEPLAAGVLSGHSITLAPGHGWTWIGSSWNTQRPQNCAPLLEEDFHNVENALYLKAFLEADGAVVIPTRCVDKNYGIDNVTTATHIASGKPWWQMTANNWAQQLGYPCSIYAASTGDCVTGQGASEAGDDYRARALKSNADGTEMYFSLHTNALTGNCLGTSCPTGTETFWNDQMTSDTYEAPSQTLAGLVQTAVIDTIRAQSDPAWVSRGVKQAAGAYTEMNVAAKPTILLELAFHDSCDTDASTTHLRDNWWRSMTMWACYKSICQFYGTTPTYGVYGAEYVSDTIPTTMIAGRPYNVSVTLRNTGVMWKDARGYHLNAVAGSDPFAAAHQTITGEIDFGQTYAFTFQMVAPAAGTYTTNWQMGRDGYSAFGPTVTKSIEVQPSDDAEAPSVPANLAATALSQTSIKLTWTASTDNVLVTGYEIRRDGAPLATCTTTTYTDTTVTGDTNYSYEVRARDFVPIYSDWSSTASA
jgi:N-acetylmuramoyl-L-alanine amidase